MIQSDTLILIRSKCNFKRFHNYASLRKKIFQVTFQGSKLHSCNLAFFNYLLTFFKVCNNFCKKFWRIFLHNFDLWALKQLSEATTIILTNFWPICFKLQLHFKTVSWEFVFRTFYHFDQNSILATSQTCLTLVIIVLMGCTTPENSVNLINLLKEQQQ